MSIDVMVVDDEIEILRMLKDHAEDYNLSIIAFQSGVQALDYLRGKLSSELPAAYFVDMKLAPSNDDRYRAELESPLEIFWLLESRKMTKYFRFLTGYFSEHDMKVQGFTNANVIIKGIGSSEQIDSVLNSISEEKAQKLKS